MKVMTGPAIDAVLQPALSGQSHASDYKQGAMQDKRLDSKQVRRREMSIS